MLRESGLTPETASHHAQAFQPSASNWLTGPRVLAEETRDPSPLLPTLDVVMSGSDRYGSPLLTAKEKPRKSQRQTQVATCPPTPLCLAATQPCTGPTWDSQAQAGVCTQQCRRWGLGTASSNPSRSDTSTSAWPPAALSLAQRWGRDLDPHGHHWEGSRWGRAGELSRSPHVHTHQLPKNAT